MCHLGIRLQLTFGVIIEVSSRFSRKTSCDKLSNARNLWRVVPLRSHLLPAGGLSGSKGRAQDVPSRISCGSLRFALPTFNSNWCGILLLQHASTNSEELQQKTSHVFHVPCCNDFGFVPWQEWPGFSAVGAWGGSCNLSVHMIIIYHIRIKSESNQNQIRIKSYSLYLVVCFAESKVQGSPETWPWKHNVLRISELLEFSCGRSAHQRVGLDTSCDRLQDIRGFRSSEFERAD